MSSDELARLKNSHVVLLARLENLKATFLEAGNGRAANGVVASMREVRRWAEQVGLTGALDVNLADPGPTTQRGDI